MEEEKKQAKCTKCGEPIIGDEDSLCGYCAGASWEEMHGEYLEENGELNI